MFVRFIDIEEQLDLSVKGGGGGEKERVCEGKIIVVNALLCAYYKKDETSRVIIRSLEKQDDEPVHIVERAGIKMGRVEESRLNAPRKYKSEHIFVFRLDFENQI